MRLLDRLRQWLSGRAEAGPELPFEPGSEPPAASPHAHFTWSAPGRSGEIGYALREAVREKLGAPVSTGAAWQAFLLDIDLERDDRSWTDSNTLYVNPREGDWTKVRVPDGSAVYRVDRIADDATTTRLEHGTRLAYRGASVDATEGLEGDLLEVLDGPRAGDFVYLGSGSRFGTAVWAAARTLVPGGSPGLDDPALPEELLALMRAVAMEHGAPGFAPEAAAAPAPAPADVSEPVGEERSE